MSGFQGAKSTVTSKETTVIRVTFYANNHPKLEILRPPDIPRAERQICHQDVPLSQEHWHPSCIPI
jgi:hypothetical protein